MKKTILITGASRGIGAEIARAAGKADYKVGVNYLGSKAAAQALVREICDSGGEALALQADVSRLDDVERLFCELDAAYGPLDVLVNNAGKLANFRVDTTDESNLSGLFGVNMFGAFYCSREAIRRMSHAHGGKGGCIINMSSVASRLGGLSGGAAYAASKGAMDAFTLSLAKEVGLEGVRVNGLRPGLIETEIHEMHGGLAHVRELAKSLVPLGRSGTAAEVAAVALWLASDAASYVHGAVVDVSGGR
ncbi:SDR family oxidoreductase [Paralcaligenes sp. KSB-10]|uniref:SDR family oxidoreductase n=1 Tax=Paralcaligenes sp. KSB-10 TaxID=2901142 RepID=UPI001E5D8480|nr:SDR family oxidoreductase [Paralcaligenes sp. KSB-10]UHL65062.1 SDR family oxidoreductase [Paralcaligenes sp. KSB-10]